MTTHPAAAPASALALPALRHILEHDAYLLPAATVERMRGVVAAYDQAMRESGERGACGECGEHADA